jgi:translation initiation factor 2 gamma subunit (eIF-2gamma)
VLYHNGRVLPCHQATELDPSLTRDDKLVGHCMGPLHSLPPVHVTLLATYKLATGGAKGTSMVTEMDEDKSQDHREQSHQYLHQTMYAIGLCSG